MKRNSIFSKCSIIFWVILFTFSCNESSNQNVVNGPNVLKDSLNTVYTLDDIILFSNNKYGFQNKDGTINEFYGDFDIVSVEKSLFDFNVGCGGSGDFISVLVTKKISKNNLFNIYIPKGDKYFGKAADSNEKVGELEIISENEIRGYIKLCLEEGSGCCGEVGENFILKKISTSTGTSSKTEKGFTIKKHKDLPSWFKKSDRVYMFNDDRIVENELIEYVGGHLPNKGDIFFINDAEVIFPGNNNNINKEKTVITKTLKSGKYTIKIFWDSSLTSGAYSEGTINLYYENEPVFNSSLIISGW
jgi:hypothetical protein